MPLGSAEHTDLATPIEKRLEAEGLSHAIIGQLAAKVKARVSAESLSVEARRQSLAVTARQGTVVSLPRRGS
jgi:hypothetical protein